MHWWWNTSIYIPSETMYKPIQIFVQKNKGMNIKINITFVMVFHHDIYKFASTSYIHIDAYPKDIVKGLFLSQTPSESSYMSWRYPSQIFLVFQMFISFTMVACHTISSFLSSHISFPGASNQISSIVVNHLIPNTRTYYVDFI